MADPDSTRERIDRALAQFANKIELLPPDHPERREINRDVIMTVVELGDNEADRDWALERWLWHCRNARKAPLGRVQ